MARANLVPPRDHAPRPTTVRKTRGAAVRVAGRIAVSAREDPPAAIIYCHQGRPVIPSAVGYHQEKGDDMPLFLCRWPNGDCSVVWAPRKEDAIVELDQVGNAEACTITQVCSFQVHFVLNEQGKLMLEALGEGTEKQIVSFAYPVLDQALSDAYGDGVYDSYETLPPDRRAAIATAVEAERSRLAGVGTPTAEPLTALGRDVKNQTDIPTILVDRIVRHVATKQLKGFKGRSKPS